MQRVVADVRRRPVAVQREDARVGDGRRRVVHGERRLRRDGRDGQSLVVVVQRDGPVVVESSVGRTRSRACHEGVHEVSVAWGQVEEGRQHELQRAVRRRGDGLHLARVEPVALRHVLHLQVDERAARAVARILQYGGEEAVGRDRRRHGVVRDEVGDGARVGELLRLRGAHQVRVVDDEVLPVGGGAEVGGVVLRRQVQVHRVLVAQRQRAVADRGSHRTRARPDELRAPAAQPRVVDRGVVQVELDVHNAGVVGLPRQHHRQAARHGDGGGDLRVRGRAREGGRAYDGDKVVELADGHNRHGRHGAAGCLVLIVVAGAVGGGVVSVCEVPVDFDVVQRRRVARRRGDVDSEDDHAAARCGHTRVRVAIARVPLSNVRQVHVQRHVALVGGGPVAVHGDDAGAGDSRRRVVQSEAVPGGYGCDAQSRIRNCLLQQVLRVDVVVGVGVGAAEDEGGHEVGLAHVEDGEGRQEELQ